MFIHVGNKITISINECIGIFNTETLKMSDENNWITSQLSRFDRTIAVNSNNSFISSNVSPYTVIKRDSMLKHYIWRR